MAGVWPDCPHCGREYRYRTEDPTADDPADVPPICGRPFCRAVQEWGDAEWEGRARMAEAGIAAGREPDEWDSEALRRRR